VLEPDHHPANGFTRAAAASVLLEVVSLTLTMTEATT
jgi:hypothetical protein